jgi:acyl carrier protein
MNDRLRKILAEIFALNVGDIHLELSKDDVGNWDSLKQMDLVTTLEREYSVELGIPEIIKMVSVESIVEVLLEKDVDFGD